MEYFYKQPLGKIDRKSYKGVYELYRFLNRMNCIKIPSSEITLNEGDILFFNYLLDTDGDFKYDTYSHIGFITSVDEEGTATFYHCLKNHGGIQKGKINLKYPKSKHYNTFLKVMNQKYFPAQILASIGKVDLLSLRGRF